MSEQTTSKTITELKPDLADAWHNRGLTYALRGSLDEAIADFSKVIELAPDRGDGYRNRGIAYRKLERYGEAVTDFTKLIELEPDRPIGYLNRAMAYEGSGEYDKARLDVEACRRRGGTVPEDLLAKLRKAPPGRE